jgi:predicted lipoprotein with Yx(FWY)xxD motif
MTRNFKMRSGTLLYILIISAYFISCKKDNSGTINNTPGAKIRLTSTRLGKVLSDSSGRTLYLFSDDADSNSTCTGGCLITWPVFYEGNLTLDTGLNASDFGTIHRNDGSLQTTYKGWPLYYFQNDHKAGDVNGEGIENIWFAAKTDYTVMYVKDQLKGLDGVNYDSTYHPGNGQTLYLTDDKGRTLYTFSPDHFKKNTYTKSDFSNNGFWPIFEMSQVNSIPSTIDRSQFDTIHVFGKVQLTFKGWPLYYFSGDHGERGSNKGISSPRPGLWPVRNQFSPTAPL